MEDKIPTKVTIHDLPSKVRVSIPEKEDTTASHFIAIIGYAILALGGLFIIFGPETIYYNRSEGMTFVQFLQAYPGPIATVGALIAALGSKMINSAESDFSQELSDAFNDAVQIDDEEIPDGYKLDVDKTEDEGIFYISLVDQTTKVSEVV
ncbi:hypothetical protein ACRTDJ_06800 [Shewanella algae]